MDSIKEIRNHIDSVQQTLKITNAMYLISSSKLRKAREQLTNVQPYFVKTTQTISDILHRTQDVEHIYFDRRPGKPHKAGFIIITGDKGLAGAYNHNVLRLAEEHMQKFDDPTLFLIGQTGRSYFRHKGVTVDVEFMYTAQDPTPPRAREIADLFVEHFRKGRLDEVYVVYTELVTPLQLQPKILKLLPLDRDAFPWQGTRGKSFSSASMRLRIPQFFYGHFPPGQDCFPALNLPRPPFLLMSSPYDIDDIVDQKKKTDKYIKIDDFVYDCIH